MTLLLSVALVATTACRSEYKKHCDLGGQLRNEERYEEAIREYELAAQAAPTEVRPHENIAKIYKHQGKYGLAAKYYRKALQANPAFIDGYAQLVKMLRLAGQIDEASKVGSEALQKTEVKRDMKASRQIQEQMVEIENMRKARGILQPSSPPPTMSLTPPTTLATTAPFRGATQTTATVPAVVPSGNIKPPTAQPE